jgi:hypothetical protein
VIRGCGLLLALRLSLSSASGVRLLRCRGDVTANIIKRDWGSPPKAAAPVPGAQKFRCQRTADAVLPSQNEIFWRVSGPLPSFGLRASSSAPHPALMANGSFAVPLPFPPACAIGTQPLPTRRECLECSRVGQADRTPSLRAGNLHGIPSTAPPSEGGAFRRPPRPNQQLPLTHKIRLPCRRTVDQWAPAQCTKTCRPSDRWAVQFVRKRDFPN